MSATATVQHPMRLEFLGIFLICCALFGAGVAVSARRDLNSPDAREVVVLLVGVVLAALGYGIETLVVADAAKAAARCLEHLGFGVAAAAFAAVSARLTGFEFRAGSAALPILAACATLPPILGLIGFPSGAFLTIAGIEREIPVAIVSRGPLFWFHTLLCLACLGAGAASLVVNRGLVSPCHRQAADLLAASATPVILVALARALGAPLLAGIDPVPVVMVAAGGFPLLVLRRRDLLDPKPLARDRLMESFPDGIVAVDSRGTIVDHNAEAARLLDLTSSVVGRTANDVLRGISRLATRVGADRTVEVEFADRVVRLRSTPLSGADGRSAGLILSVHDATAARAAERALAASLERESRLGGLGRELSVPRPVEELPGIVLPLIGAILEADECSLALEIDGVISSGTWTPAGGVTPGSTFPALERREGALSLLIDLGGNTVGALGAVRSRPFDAGDETAAETARWMLVNAAANAALMNEMARAALTDALTGLRNRKSFLAEAERETKLAGRHGRKLSVAILDLDHFKAINDLHGHSAGDAVLIRLARRIVESARRTDVVCRWGGEEFAILMPESDVVDGGIAVDRVRRAVETDPFVLDDGTAVRLTVSAGVAAPLPDRPDIDVEEVMERADRALYAAKHEGRNRVMIDDGGG